jgi:hypothetical protein
MINVTFQGKDHDDVLKQIRDFSGDSVPTPPVEQHTISANKAVEQSVRPDFTFEDLKKLVSELTKTDRDKVKFILAQFNAARLSNVDEKHHPKLYQLLTEAVSNG